MNLEEVARLAGVSRSTVSRVVNGDRRVSAAARSRVEEVIRSHGYHPHAAARSLASRRTRIVGLRIPDAAGAFVGYPYFSTLTQGVTDACNAADHDLLLMLESANDPTTVERRHARVIRGRHLDGLIVGSSIVDDPLVCRLQAERFPAVVVGRFPALPDVSFVDIDNRAAARAAVAHLIEHGCRRIATITGPDHIVHALDRTAGYRDALAEAGLAPDPALIVNGRFDEAGGYTAMRRLLERGPSALPDAVFAASDAMAVGALRALREARLEVPRRLAMIGFDGLASFAASWPTLSTVEQPTSELGREAVSSLFARIERPDGPPSVRWLPTRLLLRGSCGCAAGPRPIAGARGTVDAGEATRVRELAAVG